MFNLALISGTICLALAARSASPTHLHYTLRVDPADTTGITVELQVRGAPASMVLAAQAHPEYDDKYWRYLSDLRAVGSGSTALTVTRRDSVLWTIGNVEGDVTVRYHVRFPFQERPRSSWKPFLSPTGGLVGGPHSFLYVVGAENAEAAVTLDLPTGWKVGTGLAGPSTAREFKAANVHALMESPMLVGRMSEWAFRVNNVPHRIFYWRLPNATSFDTVAFARGIEKTASGAFALFGAAPYESFTFLMQDGAYSGGLEHPNSVTLGAPSADLAKSPNATLPETAHEFFHTWNLVAIKPVGYHDVDYRPQTPVAELWFSEGLTMFYADLLLRRAELPAEDSTRVAHLEHLATRYLAMPGNAHFSAEEVSRAEYNAADDALGDYSASTHLQGELLGSMLDFRVRSATNGSRTIDDVMRRMYNRFNGKRFGNIDVEQAVKDVCNCNVSDVFDGYIRHAGTIDFQRFLSPLGMRLNVSWVPALGRDGRPAPDMSMWAEAPENEKLARIHITNANGLWARAGLHTGDQLVGMNGEALTTWPEFRRFSSRLAIGDTVAVVARRNGKQFTTRVIVAGYDAPRVQIEQIPSASTDARRLGMQWMQGR